MAGFTTKICFLFFVLALLLHSALSAFAQGISATPAGGDNTVTITAKVVGCGDNIIDLSVGEQCEGPNLSPYDLNGQTCESLGYDSGILSCRPMSCIFDISNCRNKKKGSKVRDVSEVFELRTRIVFNGHAQPGSTFFVVANSTYLTSVSVDSDGNFSVPIIDIQHGNYDFQFYALSSDAGLMGPENFSQYIQQGMTTYISNIFIQFPFIEEVIEVVDPETPNEEILTSPVVAPTSESTDANTETSLGTNNTPSLSGDLYAQFLDVLSQNENLTPDELRKLIEDFSRQHGYEAQVPGYSSNGYRIGLLPYLQRQWMKLPEVGRRWYPNVYVSFMEPYRIFFYEASNWFYERHNPVTYWLH